MAQGPKDLRCVEGGHRRLPSLVFRAVRETAAVQSLRKVVTGKHTVADWGRGVQRNSGKPSRHGVADVLEMGRAAPDHGTKADDRVMLHSKLLRDHGQLQSTGNPDDDGLAHTARPSRLERALQQCIDNLRVPARRDHAKGEVRRVNRDVGRPASPCHDNPPV